MVDDALSVYSNSSVAQSVVFLSLALIIQDIEGRLDLPESVRCIWSFVLVRV